MRIILQQKGRIMSKRCITHGAVEFLLEAFCVMAVGTGVYAYRQVHKKIDPDSPRGGFYPHVKKGVKMMQEVGDPCHYPNNLQDRLTEHSPGVSGMQSPSP